MKSRPHDEAMAELYHSDPALAAEVINAMLLEDDQRALLPVLRQLAHAFDNARAVADIARSADVGGDPTLTELASVLKGLDMALQVTPLPIKPASAPSTSCARSPRRR